MTFDEADCRAVSIRTSPKGGQHVGTTDTSVKVIHVPTGLTATVSARSQHKSRLIAMEMIQWGLTHGKDLQ
jgi:protein subunit release factor A